MKTRRLTSKRYNEFKYTHISERIENLLKCVVGVVLFFLVCLMGASCSTPEMEEKKEINIHISHDPVPQFLIDTYQSESKEVITITPETITIDAETYFLPAYRTIDNKGCWYSLYLENGTEIRLKYFRLKYGYINFNNSKYYKDENIKNYITE